MDIKKQKIDFSDEKPENNNNDTQVEDSNGLGVNRIFNYLEKNDNSFETFTFEGDEKSEPFSIHKGNFEYSICILLKDDSFQSSFALDKTLTGIYKSLDTLSDIGISKTIVCIFVKKIRSYPLFNVEKLSAFKNDKNYFLYVSAQKAGYPTSNIYLITKPNELNEVEALRCFYLGVINQIKEDKKTIFSSVITAGVEPNTYSLKKLIMSSYNSNNNRGASVGLIDTYGKGIFSQIENYERTHFNLYDMNFYGSASVVPICSLFSTICIDNSIYSLLSNYYQFIEKNQSIDYHDYNLALYFYKNKKNVNFFSSEICGTLYYDSFIYCDYQETWINRYSGYYANFFNLLGELFNCDNFNVVKKLLLIFQIIGMMIDFIYPSLSSMVIYSILYEAFDTYDYRVATFFTMLYIFMLAASGMCSLVTKKPQEIKFANVFLYILMEIFYFFVLICSIVAMDNIHKNRNKDEYKFNKAAISCLIIFTFIPYIIPILMKIGTISSKLLNMIMYLVLGASCSTSNFLIAKLWNAAEAPGGNQVEERKGIVLIFFFAYNLFFGCLTFYNNTRRKRANCVLGLGVLYLIYNFFKIMGIICKILNSNDDSTNTVRNNKLIESIKKDLWKGDDNDYRSEEKMIKNNMGFKSNEKNTYEGDRESNNNNEFNNSNDNNPENNNELDE
jgi:hypothetical protein